MNSLEQHSNDNLESQPLATGLLAEAQQLLKQRVGQKSAPEQKHPLLENALSNPQSYTEHMIKMLYQNRDQLVADLRACLSIKTKAVYGAGEILEILMNKVVFPRLAHSQDFSAFFDSESGEYFSGFFSDFLVDVLRPAFSSLVYAKEFCSNPSQRRIAAANKNNRFTLADEIKRFNFDKDTLSASTYYKKDLENICNQLGYEVFKRIAKPVNYSESFSADELPQVIDFTIASLLPDLRNDTAGSSFKLNLDKCECVLSELEKYLGITIIAAKNRKYLELLLQSHDLETAQLDARKYAQIYKEQYGKDDPPLLTDFKERLRKKRFVKNLHALKIDQGVKILANLIKFCFDLNETSKIYLSNPSLSEKKRQEARLLGAIAEIMAGRLNDLAGELEVRLRVGNLNLDKLLQYQGFLANINSSGASDALLQMVAKLENEFQIATEVKQDFQERLEALSQRHIENGQLPPLIGAESD